MPPLVIPKQHNLPYQPYNDCIQNGTVHKGPPTTGFSIIDAETMDDCVFELEAARMLGRVQSFVREYRYQDIASISDAAGILSSHIEEHIMMLRVKMQNSGSWAGVAVVLR